MFSYESHWTFISCSFIRLSAFENDIGIFSLIFTMNFIFFPFRHNGRFNANNYSIITIIYVQVNSTYIHATLLASANTCICIVQLKVVYC